ncbi:MAG: GNAT family N-acetyltransferase [Bacteroidetes bacterium]|nr:GNAT family N-acetyltransferase [Bacteroidota bacterium]
MLKGNNCYLRVVEKDDAMILFQWENNMENWKVSNTEIPFSMHSIHQLIDQQSDLRTSGQLRFIICQNESDNRIGTLDLYDVNFKHGHASIGILIALEEHKRKGIASEGIQLITSYCRDILDLKNLQCFIHQDNTASIALFEHLGFKRVGEKINWLVFKGVRFNELTYQLCLKEH